MGVTWSDTEDGRDKLAMPSSFVRSPRASKSQPPKKSHNIKNSADTVEISTSPVRTSGRERKLPKKLQEQDERGDEEKVVEVKICKSRSRKNRVDSRKKRPIPVKDSTLAAASFQSHRPTKKAKGSPSDPKHVQDDENSNWYLPQAAATWTHNYKTLVAFQKRFGHSNVPQNTVHGKLARWCYLQKRQRQFNKLGPSKIRKLDRLGFDWTYVAKSGKRPSFEDKCAELKSFKNKHGHCDVPVSGKYILLGQWLYCMKRRRVGVYKRCRQLTQDQIDQLDAIGVDWALTGMEAEEEEEMSSDSSDKSDDDEDSR